MRLLGISDLHLSSAFNRAALAELERFPDDWLALAGDVGETVDQLRYALEVLTDRFAKVLWVPGNHDLWSIDPERRPLKGEAKYRRLVEVCRQHDVLTPEDPYPTWPGDADGKIVIAPLFLLYDYSFRPPWTGLPEALAQARTAGLSCSDEDLLDPAPHASRSAWCALRMTLTERRLEEASSDGRETVLINHFPLRQDLIGPPLPPEFALWCGTSATEDWHLRFNAKAVVYGHLHMRGSASRDGVAFEEVSLGYPREWVRQRGVASYLRVILPAVQ